MTGRVDIVRSIYEKIAKKFKLNSQYPETTDFFLTFIDKYTKNKVFWSCDFIFSFLQFLQNLQIIISISFPFSSPYFFCNPEKTSYKRPSDIFSHSRLWEYGTLYNTTLYNIYYPHLKIGKFQILKKKEPYPS